MNLLNLQIWSCRRRHLPSRTCLRNQSSTPRLDISTSLLEVRKVDEKSLTQVRSKDGTRQTRVFQFNETESIAVRLGVRSAHDHPPDFP